MRFAASSLVFLAAVQLTSIASAQAPEAPPPAAPAQPPAEEAENVSDSDKERARVLFDEGRQLMTDGKIAEACAKFGESQKVRPGIGTLYNLADCNEKLGKTATAFKLFEEVAERTKAALQEDRMKKAQERLAVLEPKLMKIRLAVPAGGKVKSVTLDGETVDPEDFNKAIPADPGEHTIIAITVKDDGEPFEETVELDEEGKTMTVAIPVAAGAKMKRRVGMIIGGGITMGVGAIALGSAIYLGAQDDYELLPAAVGLGILGVAGLGVGIPIFAVGFKKKPVRGAELDELPILEASPVPQIAVGPTGASATWHW
ncbi:MAG: hypothetical protein IPG04_20095 [Polyangiaceae bacterium]|jgi:tetratricopeptide (TPR) repeat protein|nr:hypothetical protein [Polyangiaceae bacterium]